MNPNTAYVIAFSAKCLLAVALGATACLLILHGHDVFGFFAGVACYEAIPEYCPPNEPEE